GLAHRHEPPAVIEIKLDQLLQQQSRGLRSIRGGCLPPEFLQARYGSALPGAIEAAEQMLELILPEGRRAVRSVRQRHTYGELSVEDRSSRCLTTLRTRRTVRSPQSRSAAISMMLQPCRRNSSMRRSSASRPRMSC